MEAPSAKKPKGRLSLFLLAAAILGAASIGRAFFQKNRQHEVVLRAFSQHPCQLRLSAVVTDDIPEAAGPVASPFQRVLVVRHGAELSLRVQDAAGTSSGVCGRMWCEVFVDGRLRKTDQGLEARCEGVRAGQ